VFGNNETSEIDILQQLDLDGWTSLIGFDADAARERIAGLDWVKATSVRKVYPDAIHVARDGLRSAVGKALARELAEAQKAGAAGRDLSPNAKGIRRLKTVALALIAAAALARLVWRRPSHAERAPAPSRSRLSGRPARSS